MEIAQKTYWSKTSIVVTALVGALMAGVLYFIESVSTVVAILLLLSLIVMCVTALMFMPIEVSLSDRALTVKFLARCKVLPRSEIVEAVPFADSKRMWRLCKQNDIIMEAVQRKATLFRLSADLLERLKEMAKEEHRSLNNFVECILLDVAYNEPNELTKAAMEEARSGKLRNTPPLDLSSIESMEKSMES